MTTTIEKVFTKENYEKMNAAQKAEVYHNTVNDIYESLNTVKSKAIYALDFKGKDVPCPKEFKLALEQVMKKIVAEDGTEGSELLSILDIDLGYIIDDVFFSVPEQSIELINGLTEVFNSLKKITEEDMDNIDSIIDDIIKKSSVTAINEAAKMAEELKKGVTNEKVKETPKESFKIKEDKKLKEEEIKLVKDLTNVSQPKAIDPSVIAPVTPVVQPIYTTMVEDQLKAFGLVFTKAKNDLPEFKDWMFFNIAPFANGAKYTYAVNDTTGLIRIKMEHASNSIDVPFNVWPEYLITPDTIMAFINTMLYPA